MVPGSIWFSNFQIRSPGKLTEENKDASTLQAWQQAILTVPFCIKVLPRSTRYFEAISMREAVAGDYAAAYFTAYQRIWMVQRFKDSWISCSLNRLGSPVRHYLRHSQWASMRVGSSGLSGKRVGPRACRAPLRSIFRYVGSHRFNSERVDDYRQRAPLGARQTAQETETALKGPQTAKMIAAAYTDNQVRMAADSEKITDSFVDAALTVFSRALSNPKILEAVSSIDQEYGLRGPFSKVFILEGIIKKAKTPQMIEWSFLSIADMFRSGVLQGEDLSLRGLTGYGTSGGKGMVDLIVFKYDMLRYFVDVFINKHAFDRTCLPKLKQVYENHEQYRAMAFPQLMRSRLATDSQPQPGTEKFAKAQRAKRSRIKLVRLAASRQSRVCFRWEGRAASTVRWRGPLNDGPQLSHEPAGEHLHAQHRH